MFADIPGDSPDHFIRLHQLFLSGEVLLQLGFLGVFQVIGVAFKPTVNSFRVQGLTNAATFVEEADNSIIFDGLANGIGGLNHPAKLLDGLFTLFEQRCSGEANQASAGEYPAHRTMEAAELGTVAFIDENEDIGTVVAVVATVEEAIEFVDYGGYRLGLRAVEEFPQVVSGGSLGNDDPAVSEGFFNLVVEVSTVGDEDDTGVLDIVVGVIRLVGDRLSEKDHRNAFATTLSMPDHTASPLVVLVGLKALQNALDGKVLLITGNFANSGIKEGKTVGEF